MRRVGIPRYRGTVEKVDADTAVHVVRYADGEVRDEQLLGRRFRLHAMGDGPGHAP